MSYMSNITITGNLGHDPEMRYTPAGKAVTNFSVAVNRQYTGTDGQLVKETAWFKVSAWGKSAEACSKYLKKGSMVLVEGRLDYDRNTGGPKIWTAADGTPHADLGLIASVVRFLSPKDASAAPAADDGDDLPF